MPKPVVLISGGAGYIGSHVAYLFSRAGFTPVVIDNLSNGNRWAAEKFGPFRRGDVGNADFVAGVCREFQPIAALHFAAFIDVAESVREPEKYFENNRDKAMVFFDTLAANGVKHVVFSSTAATYGQIKGHEPIREDHRTKPINPYGASKLEAETYLRTIEGITSVTLRYFNVAGAAAEVGLGEAHYPETHVIPRIVLPLIGASEAVQKALDLGRGFQVFGTDYPTRDGTAIRDYIHVMDLAEAHFLALRYLIEEGETAIFNLGSGEGYSVHEIVQAARIVLGKPDYQPSVAPRREGDPAILVADNALAKRVLGWVPERDVDTMIKDAADWHRNPLYTETILQRAAHRA